MADSYYLWKPIDDGRVSDTTLQNDLFLGFPVGINETWVVWLMLVCTFDSNLGSASGLKYALSVPSGATATGMATAARDNVAGAEGAVQTLGSKAASVLQAETRASADEAHCKSMWLVRNGGTAGNVVLQWAQIVSDATPLRVRKTSSLIAFKVS